MYTQHYPDSLPARPPDRSATRATQFGYVFRLIVQNRDKAYGLHWLDKSHGLNLHYESNERGLTHVGPSADGVGFFMVWEQNKNQRK